MSYFNGKTVVITGAGGGIGAALAKELGSRGAALVLADRDETSLGEIADKIRSHGTTVSTYGVDVADALAMKQFADDVGRERGIVDVLINNAGVTVGAMFAEHSIEDADWVLGVNVRGVMYGCKFFLPYLLGSADARLVNVSSMFGFMSMPGQAVYSASKGAVRGFTEALWTELADSNVRVTLVMPGVIKTGLIAASRMQDENARADSVQMLERYGMPVERAAEIILRAVEAGKPRVLVGRDAAIAERIKRMIPIGLHRLLTYGFRRLVNVDLTGAASRAAATGD